MNKIKVACALIVLCLLITMSGCTSQSYPVAEKPKVINISYSLRPINVPSIVALEKRIFEDEFAKEGIEVKWYELEGPATTEALAAKSIDIATSLNYVTAIISKANGNDINVISSYSQFPEAIGLVVHVDSGINAVTDLKGKKIALQKGTMLHEMLVKVLQEQAISINDIELVGMPSADAANALLQKHVDAAILPDPILGKVISSQKTKLLTNAQGYILGQAVIAARSDFLQQYPDIAKKFLEIHNQTLAWIETNKSEALEITSRVNGMDIKAVNALYPKFNFNLAIDENNKLQLKDSARFLKENSFVKADVNTDELIDSLVNINYLNQ